MKRGLHNRSITSLLVIFLLLFSIVCVSINATGSGSRAHSAIAIKKPGSSSTSDTQVPEKVESENDYKLNVTFFCIHSVGEIVRFDFTKSTHTCFFNATRLRGNATTIPLYLIKRSIMI